MNRLFIIGNGSDLAHGLPTSYTDFLKYCWSNIDKNGLAYINPIININLDNACSYKDLKIKISEGSNNVDESIYFDDLFFSANTRQYGPLFRIDNIFFRTLNQLNDDMGWVDIEDLYYKILKSKIKKEKAIYNYNNTIEELNKEFAEIKNLLEKYLFEEVVSKYDFQKFESTSEWKKTYDVLRRISILNNEKNIKKEFQSNKDVKSIEAVFRAEHNSGSESNNNQAYFLCFNYTPTLENYVTMLNGEEENFHSINYIHGEVNSLHNPINFGFGDEMDYDYKAIENENKNEYSTNFKSFQYFQNSNYKNFLSYMDSGEFQVCILGHSCGLSDRVLLNTIFEHPNCRSIKLYYYQNGEKDNYKDIIQNISRHFKDKKLMRALIVEKSLCSPLPQMARYVKKNES